MTAKIIPTTIPITKITTIPTKLTYIINSTIPNKIKTTIPITISATISTTISTTKYTLTSTIILSTIHNIIPTTIMAKIPTSIPSTKPHKISMPLSIHTTIHDLITSKIDTTISTSIPKKLLNLNPTSIINIKIPTTITTNTTNIIQTIISKTVTKSTINQTAKFPISIINQIISPETTIQNSIPNGETKIILVGYSHFNKYSTYFSIFIYFISIENYLFSIKMKFSLLVEYYSLLRRLERFEGDCILQNREINSKAQYLCVIQVDTSNIKKISVLPDFNFVSQNNVKLIGITPFAHMFMNEIQNIGDKFNNISESNIYVLDHSIVKKYQKNLFNISGVINGIQPNFTIKDLSLMIYTDSGNKTESEVNCIISDIIEKNYALSCMSYEIIEGNLQSAISFIDNDVLVVNFDENNESKIILNINETKKTNSLFSFK